MRMRRPARVLVTALLAASAFATTGCATDSGAGAASSSKAASVGDGAQKADGGGRTADGRAQAGDDGAPDSGTDGVPATLRFRGTTLDGKPFDGSTLAGKPVALWFWAPWCGTCRGQAPQAAALARTYRGKVHVVGIAGLDTTGPMKSFVSSTNVSGFPHVADERGAVWKKFGITQQSSFVLLDEKGEVVHSGVPTGPGELDGLVSKLVG
ncbi:redoxin family protein [Streptomyces sp. NPDC051776]|uniref:TlpA family protein disulfide reductase n=1 Tax=Streptomyces sp. NPDC051776 TaxID=3155414 RepID=UPI00344AD455